MSNATTVLSNSKQIFNDILDLNVLDHKSCTIAVCLASTEKSGIIPRFERLKISDTTSDFFRTIVEDLQKKYQTDGWRREDLLFPEFARESNPEEYQIERIDLSSYTVLLEQLAPLASLLDIDVFATKKNASTTIRFYVITIQPEEGDPVYFFRKYTAKSELGRSQWLAWLKDGEYNRIDEPVLQFDHEIDCMSRSGVMFIINKSNFQHIFQFFEEVKIVAQEALSTIKEHIPIQNFEDFASACEKHSVKMRKLKNIATKSDLSKITLDHIKTVIEKQKLPLQIVEENGKEVLAYDPKQTWVILNLLQDNYLWSLMTEQSYEVTSKRPI